MPVAAFSELRPDLAIVDDAESCRRIRFTSKVPVIVVSDECDERSKVEALDSGADDYVSRPFGVDELMARVRAALRRGAEPSAATGWLDAGDFHVDFDRRRVYVGAREVRLTPKQFDLFVFMARHPNSVLSHQVLLGAVWGATSRHHLEYLRTFMWQLRRKLEPDPSAPRYLVSVPCVGYRLNPGGLTGETLRRSGQTAEPRPALAVHRRTPNAAVNMSTRRRSASL
jgi:two-component system KDP operon response regulator KdpE